jgi:hypothetical protein
MPIETSTNIDSTDVMIGILAKGASIGWDHSAHPCSCIQPLGAELPQPGDGYNDVEHVLR